MSPGQAPWSVPRAGDKQKRDPVSEGATRTKELAVAFLWSSRPLRGRGDGSDRATDGERLSMVCGLLGRWSGVDRAAMGNRLSMAVRWFWLVVRRDRVADVPRTPVRPTGGAAVERRGGSVGFGLGGERVGFVREKWGLVRSSATCCRLGCWDLSGSGLLGGCLDYLERASSRGLFSRAG